MYGSVMSIGETLWHFLNFYSVCDCDGKPMFDSNTQWNDFNLVSCQLALLNVLLEVCSCWIFVTVQRTVQCNE